MNTYFPGCQMAAGDFRTCQTMLSTTAEAGSPLARMLQRKLGSASVVPDSEIAPLVVTLNSRVEFEIDDEPPQTRIVVGSEFRNGLVGLTLPISTLRGLALLGLRQGQPFVFDEGGHRHALLVRRVLWQPQAARWARAAWARSRNDNGADIIDLRRVRDARATGQSNSPDAVGHREPEGKRK